MYQAPPAALMHDSAFRRTSMSLGRDSNAKSLLMQFNYWAVVWRSSTSSLVLEEDCHLFEIVLASAGTRGLWVWSELKLDLTKRHPSHARPERLGLIVQLPQILCGHLLLNLLSSMKPL